MESVLGDLQGYGLIAYEHLSALAPVALAFLLLSIFVHRRNLRDVLLRLLPAGTRVNLLTYVIDAMLIAGPIGLACGALNAFLSDRGWVLPWAGAVPVAVVGFLAVFFGDFIAYFRHRFEHSRWLWSAHAMHHSDTEMSWMTLYRFHPLNRVTTVFIDTCALVALGFPPWAVVLNGAFRHYYGLFVHANVPWTLGPLGYVMVSPAMHRWHHVRSGPGVSCNFASVFSVFDRVFGTHYCPGPCDQPLGVDGVKDRSYTAQLLLPVTETYREISGKLAAYTQPKSQY